MKKFRKKEKKDQREIGLGNDQRYRSTNTVQQKVREEQDLGDQEAEKKGKGHQIQQHLFVMKDVGLKSKRKVEK